jgi:hypothetical protein
MPTQEKKITAGAAAPRKLHSIAGLLRGREFSGKFAVSGLEYQFAFAPGSAALSNGKLELTGSFTVSSARGAKRKIDNVRAVLASTQGGLGAAPARPQSLVAASQTPAAASALPVTEATDSLGFVGAMYFRLSPLDGRALGVPLDLSSVQLNARLAPTSQLERELQWLFSAAIKEAYGAPPDAKAASEHLAEINRRLS